MEVSEQVLFDALAQEKSKKNKLVKNKMIIPGRPKTIHLELKKRKPNLYNPILNLEKQILSILIHYGSYEAFLMKF